MATNSTGRHVRRVLLEVVETISKDNMTSLQSGVILRTAAKQLDAYRDQQLQEALLTCLHDLFRTGYLAWGHDLNNSDPPFCHLTTQGRLALQHLSRDPANPDGYLAHLTNQVVLNPIAKSYVDEALKTYITDCYKATAVMIGAASESIVLELRDTLAGKMQTLDRSVPNDLTDWRIARVLKSIENEITSQKRNIPKALYETVDIYWSALVGQIRTARNDAGHPSSIDPVTAETVHASLLIFPELAKLAYEIMAWIPNGYM